MSEPREAEIDRNFFAFQTILSDLLQKHSGHFALLHDKMLVSVHDKLSQAIEEGNAKFGDGRFSIQKVTDKPIDLGFFSHANNPW